MTYGDPTRQVANIIRNNSENALQYAPRIACYVRELNYDRDRMQNPYHIEKQHLRERDYNESTGEYTNQLGAGYTVEKVAAEMLPRQTSSAAKERLFAEAREVVGAFLSSDEWRRFFAPLQRAQIRMELPFLYFFPAGEVPAGTGVVEVDENYFSGQADMVLLADDRTIVVDFKSDMEIEPERHRMQLGVYRLAMEKLYGKPVQTFLAYLRFSRIVPVDDLPGPDELRGRIGELRNV